MLGGYQILDLRNIDLSRSTSETNITDVEVLKQLSQIANYIQKDYDFSKPLQNQLKPLLIRYRDKKVGEKHEVALYGNIEVINTYYKFRIIACNESEKLTINVEFEEKTDDYSNKYWDIKTAKVLLTSAQPIFEEITDKYGHKRFIEGDIDIEEAFITSGMSKTYGKWSLSGTHLMLVIAGTIADTSVIGYGKLAIINLPEWIEDKIYPVVSSYLDSKSISCRDENWSTQNIAVALVKEGGHLVLYITSGDTFTSDKGYRIDFDLLIDNESQE